MSHTLVHHPLHRADGSATFTSPIVSVLVAVNGPVDVTRRDELPEEAAIEVNVRPASGAGGPRERWLESVLAATLRHVLLVHLHPRTLIQVTLQITQEVSSKIAGAIRDTAVLPSLLNAAFLALVDGRLPLSTTVNAVLLSISADGAITLEPNEKELGSCQSAHALVFDLRGNMLMTDSVGAYASEQWAEAVEMGRQASAAAMASARSEDESMENSTIEHVPWLRQEMEEQVKQSQAWRKET